MILLDANIPLYLLIIGVLIIFYMDLAALGAVLICMLMDWSMRRGRKRVHRGFD